jgi:sugar phosphate isomerase/epimerase
MKFAICQELFENWGWERQCQFASELGYTGLELAPFTLAPRITDVSSDQRRVLRQTAERYGLQIIGLHWLLAKTEGLHLTTANASIRAATTQYLTDLTHACADLGGDLMVLGSPLQRNVEVGLSQDQAFDHAAEVLKGCLPALEQRGVRICLEPLTPKETNFINTCADAMRLIDMLGSRHVCLHQDVKAMLGGETESLETIIVRFAPHVGHFHVNDVNLLGPGMGPTDYVPIFHALKQTNYSGWISVEVFDYSPGADSIARDSINYMRSVLDQIA